MSSAHDSCQRLIVYGSLAPGGPNHHQLADICGTWWTGWIEGTLHDEGWGAERGFPGLCWQSGAQRIPVHVLESESLRDHWDRLDAFEGLEYERIAVPVFRVDSTSVSGFVYALRDSGSD